MSLIEIRLHGPPGCGKTTQLAKHWIPDAARKFGSDSVLVCSLTKTAAQELASRDTPIDKNRVGTLHAHAYRALGSPALVEGEFEHWNKLHPAYALSGGKPNGDEADLQTAMQGATDGDRLAQRMDVMRHLMVPRERWPGDVAHFASRWEAWKRETERIDFTDMIEHALRDTLIAPFDPRVLVVDEAQDCSSLELALVRQWSENAEYLVLAADGDQAIFSWRGASPKAFLEPPIPEDRNYRLTQSYRVPKLVHAPAVKWISQSSYRFAVEYRPRKPLRTDPRDEFEGRYTRGKGASNRADYIIDAIERDLDDSDADGTVMLLAACSYMLRPAIRCLRDRGILFHNPYRLKNGAWNPMRGGVDRLRAFLAPDPEIAKAEGRQIRLWTIRELNQWVDLIRSDRLPKRAKRVIASQAKASSTRDELPALSSAYTRELLGESIMAELATVFEHRKPLGPMNWLKREMLASKVKLMDYALEVARRHGRTAVIKEPRLTVGTVHSVKGSEATHVHIIPDLSPSGAREWMSIGDGRDGVLRLFYVAMTRSKQTLTVHQPGCRFFAELPR